MNVTDHPTAEWTGRQLLEAFPYDSSPKYLVRDNDKIYGEELTDKVEVLGIEEVPTAPKLPWQNPYCERVIGSIRRDCLDHILPLNEAHLRRALGEYVVAGWVGVEEAVAAGHL